MKEYAFTLYVRVYDEEALFEEALRVAVDNDGMSQDLALEVLKHDGEIDVHSCLRSIFDPGVSPPGCEIQDSSVEGTWCSAEDIK